MELVEIARVEYSLQEIASAVTAEVIGDRDMVISGVAGLETAETGDLVFAESPRFLDSALRSRASAILLTTELAAGARAGLKSLLVVLQPRLAFVQVLRLFAPIQHRPPGIHESARIGDNVRLGVGVHIGPNVIVEADSVIDDGVVLLAGVIVGEGCAVGAGTVVHSNVVLYPGVTLGRACIVHAGSVIGADGFGYVPIGNGLMKVPHLGAVEIGDEVEIGANTCIDRAKTGVTRIGSGTKIDNLVHIAHNVTVGQACLIIAQVGVAGTVTIGNGVILGGQAGIKDHVSLGDGARVGAQGGVIGDVAPGTTVSGYPARPHQDKMRELGSLTALPDALKRMRAMEKRLAVLEAALQARRSEDDASGDPAEPIGTEGAERAG